MTELKTCWTCKYREWACEFPPCSECDELLRNKWEPRK